MVMSMQVIVMVMNVVLVVTMMAVVVMRIAVALLVIVTLSIFLFFISLHLFIHPVSQSISCLHLSFHSDRFSCILVFLKPDKKEKRM